MESLIYVSFLKRWTSAYVLTLLFGKKAVKNELKEESRLRMYVQQENQELKEQATKAREVCMHVLMHKFLNMMNA